MARSRSPDHLVSASALRQRKYRESVEGAHKDRIRSRLYYALKKGRLVRLPCICGSGEVEAHHYAGYDLEHALDVVWLCKQHHERLHKHRPGGRPKKVREELSA
jgi:hypothetical protein